MGPAFALAVLLWLLAEVLLMVISACIVAVGLNSLALAVSKRVPLISRRMALIAVAVSLAISLGGTGQMLGSQFYGEFKIFLEKLPKAWEQLQVLSGAALPKLEEFELSSLGGRLAGGVMRLGSAALGAAGHFLIELAAGFFIAWNPDMYWNGVVALTPPRHRADIESVVVTVGRAWAL